MTIRVVKVGGSLLDLPDLPNRIRSWLAAQSAAHHVLIPGGGPFVEHLRKWHAVQPIHETAAHWMCIDLMSVAAHYLHQRLPEIPLVEDDRWLCQRLGDRACTIFGVAPWLRQNEARLPGERLPASWQVTSDSIAARLAYVLGADELVLLKSALPEASESCDITRLVQAGYVDAMFPRFAQGIRSCRLVNLRLRPFQQIEARDVPGDSK